MVPRKLSVMIARYPYAGNGGYSSEIPDIGDWLVETVSEMNSDPRIGEVIPWRKSDTPIPMVRNESVLVAKNSGADLLLMIDSDNVPDYELSRGDKSAKPFWKTAFDFLYSHYDKGPCVVGAPYCGPPPHENVYVFQISNRESEHANVDFQIDQFSRHQAAERTGIERVAALPTGLILFDLRVFDYLPPPWFYYEYTDKFQWKKASTEDVTATRDMWFHAHLAQKPFPLYVTWDCWAGHVKPKVVGKPQIITMDQVSQKYVEAVKNGQDSRERITVVDGLDKFLSQGARPITRAINEKQPSAPVSAPPASFDEAWQTPTWMLNDYGFTPQQDLHVLRRIVQDAAARLGREPIVVELGTYIGQSAKAMADAGAVVFTIDNREGNLHDPISVHYAIRGKEDIERACKENLGEMNGRKVHLLIGDCIEAARTWHKPVDILYVDANHDYGPTKEATRAWLGHVCDGGIIAGHDYDKDFPGVVQAANELFGDDLRIDGRVWWTVKKTASVAINRLAGVTHPNYEEDDVHLIANGHAAG